MSSRRRSNSYSKSVTDAAAGTPVTDAAPMSPRTKTPLSPRSPRSPMSPRNLLFGSVRGKKSPVVREDLSVLFVRVIEARDYSGSDALYCKVFLGNESYRTRIVKSKPEWKQDFHFHYAQGEGGYLLLQLWAKKKLAKDNLIGETRVDLNRTFEPEADPVSYPLQNEKGEQSPASLLVYIEEEGRKKTPAKKKAFEAPAIYNMSWDVEEEKSALEPSILLKELGSTDALIVSGRSQKLGPLKLQKTEMDDIRMLHHTFANDQHTVVVTLPRDYSTGTYEQKFTVQLKIQSAQLLADRVYQINYQVTKEDDRVAVTFNGRAVTKKFKDTIPITGAFVLRKSAYQDAHEQNPLTGFEVKPTEVNELEMFTVDFNREKLVKLFERGDDINIFDEEGETLLHNAVTFSDDVELIQFLIENGANPSKRNKNGKTAIDYAQRVFKNQHLQVLQSYLAKS